MYSLNRKEVLVISGVFLAIISLIISAMIFNFGIITRGVSGAVSQGTQVSILIPVQNSSGENRLVINSNANTLQLSADSKQVINGNYSSLNSDFASENSADSNSLGGSGAYMNSHSGGGDGTGDGGGSGDGTGDGKGTGDGDGKCGEGGDGDSDCDDSDSECEIKKISDPALNINGQKTYLANENSKINVSFDLNLKNCSFQTNNSQMDNLQLTNELSLANGNQILNTVDSDPLILNILIYDFSNNLILNLTIIDSSITDEDELDDYILDPNISLNYPPGEYLLILNLMEDNNGIYEIEESTSTHFNITGMYYYAISLSNTLQTGVVWSIANLPVIDYPANGNNENIVNNFNNSNNTNTANITNVPSNLTEYDVLVEASSGVNVDLYIKGSGNLLNSGTGIIPLANEKIKYNLSNLFVPNTILNSLTTSYSNNLIGSNLTNSSKSYLKFYLSIPGGQEFGIYNNTLFIKGVLAGNTP